MVEVGVEQHAFKAELDAAVATLGISMRERFAPRLAVELGRTWYKTVHPAQGLFAEYDFASYADCLIGDKERARIHRDLFRQIAGQSWSDYGHVLIAAKRARNTIAHPGRLFDRRSTAELLEPLVAVSAALGLSATPLLAEQLDTIRSGRFTSAAVRADEDATPNLVAELDREREAKAAAAEDARIADDRATRHAAELTQEVNRRKQETALRLQAEAALELQSHSQAERTRLLEESQRHRQAEEAARRRAELAEAEAQSSRAERDLLTEKVIASQRRILELEGQALTRSSQASPLERAQSSAGVDHFEHLAQPSLTRDTSASETYVQAALKATEQASADAGDRHPPQANATRAAHHVRPGEDWPYGAGEFRYSLRTASEDVYDPETGSWLSDAIGKERAREVVKRLSAYRPEGGTIRVDADGDVSSQRKSGGGRFYLGRVDASEWFPGDIPNAPAARAAEERNAPAFPVAATSSTPQIVRPGDRWPYGAGESCYSLRPSVHDVYEYSTESWLSDAIGKSVSDEVVTRLLQHRPEGGTIRVDSDGDVTTQRKSGGGRFYLGSVESSEWFPGVVEQSVLSTSAPARAASISSGHDDDATAGPGDRGVAASPHVGTETPLGRMDPASSTIPSEDNGSEVHERDEQIVQSLTAKVGAVFSGAATGIECYLMPKEADGELLEFEYLGVRGVAEEGIYAFIQGDVARMMTRPVKPPLTRRQTDALENHGWEPPEAMSSSDLVRPSYAGDWTLHCLGTNSEEIKRFITTAVTSYQTLFSTEASDVELVWEVDYVR